MIGVRRPLLGLCLAVAMMLGLAQSSAAAPGLHVSGSRLLDGRGHQVALRGVNRSGPEYACIQGWGIFDGPSDAASISAMTTWHINFVRVPINEDCWLGINDVKPSLGGAAYRRAIVNYVEMLERHGIYPEVSLIWAAPGHNRATYQAGAPDEDHAPAAWRGMAAAFRHDPKVILAPWGETVVDAHCFLDGGMCEATYGPRNQPYRVAGMQQAVNVIRTAGYRGVISIPGIDYANNLSHWLSREPTDPRHQLVAEAHVYGGNTCSSVACLDRTMAPVARRVPLIFGEFGENYQGTDCSSTNVGVFLAWALAHHVGTAAWTWDTWSGCGVLIKSYRGTPANAYGRFVRAWYLAH